MWLAALGLHALNDHALKGGGIVPGPITGKLSDVAVLVVTPTVLAVLVGVRTRRGWLAAHLAMGTLFVALELSSSFTAAWARLIALLGFGWVTWSDWTDLLTLPALAVSFVVLGRAARLPHPAAPQPLRSRRALEVLLVACASLLCIATSDVQCPGDEVVDPDDDADGAPWSIDCDDEDSGRAPHHGEVAADGIDQDCDGRDATVAELACAGAGWLPLGEPRVIDTRTAAAELAVGCAAPGDTLAFRAQPLSPTGAAIGWLDVTVASDTPHAVAIQRTCDVRGELACGDDGARALVFADETPFILVRPLDAGGEATVTVRFEPLLCGDGLVVPPEECDDGAREPGDGCDPQCREEGLP